MFSGIHNSLLDVCKKEKQSKNCKHQDDFKKNILTTNKHIFT